MNESLLTRADLATITAPCCVCGEPARVVAGVAELAVCDDHTNTDITVTRCTRCGGDVYDGGTLCRFHRSDDAQNAEIAALEAEIAALLAAIRNAPVVVAMRARGEAT